MNCCDDFGQCQQGPNCPVRQQQAADLPPLPRRPGAVSGWLWLVRAHYAIARRHCGRVRSLRIAIAFANSFLRTRKDRP